MVLVHWLGPNMHTVIRLAKRFQHFHLEFHLPLTHFYIWMMYLLLILLILLFSYLIIRVLIIHQHPFLVGMSGVQADVLALQEVYQLLVVDQVIVIKLNVVPQLPTILCRHFQPYLVEPIISHFGCNE